VTKLAPFDGTANNVLTSSSSSAQSGNVIITTTTTSHEWTGPLSLSLEAAHLTQETPDVDLRVEAVTARADEWPFGVSYEAFVEVEGHSSRVGGIK
jgi:hypothetical protein